MNSFSLVKEKDFDVAKPVGFTKVAESASLVSNAYAFNTSYKAIHVNDNGLDKQGMFTISLGYAQKGDFLKISAEMMSISGERPRIVLDRSLTTPVGSIDGTSFVFQSEKVGEFERVEVEYLCEHDAYYTVSFGSLASDISEFYLKNCYVTIETKFAPATKYKQGFRTYVVLGTSGSYAVQTNFADDLATLTVDSVNKEILLTHGRAFSGSKAGVGIVGEISSGVSPSYRVKLQSFSLAGCKIKIYDVATNTLQDPATISGALWFSLLFSGSDFAIDTV